MTCSCSYEVYAFGKWHMLLQFLSILFCIYVFVSLIDTMFCPVLNSAITNTVQYKVNAYEMHVIAVKFWQQHAKIIVLSWKFDGVVFDAFLRLNRNKLIFSHINICNNCWSLSTGFKVCQTSELNNKSEEQQHTPCLNLYLKHYSSFTNIWNMKIFFCSSPEA